MSVERPGPEAYNRVFDGHHEGRLVFEDLRLRFAAQQPFVRGGRAAERDSCYRQGQWSVINYILAMINRDPTDDPNREGNDNATR
jgi:hypothetical protein